MDKIVVPSPEVQALSAACDCQTPMCLFVGSIVIGLIVWSLAGLFAKPASSTS